ncbi:hypothetical protein EW146_g3225 [Bondarzewia mesenterica]|uniref:Uncharacterized protein n=1 Tax=Bondarzewia mesenterica TaxID=1095465 RepID=A0A4S4M0H3_9AGAM|nr:hypothetical protein EW146_g3225 [Bondarzewia mesenterica]
MAEDLQPNEARLARKGNTRVPLVRIVKPTTRHARGSFIHDSRGDFNSRGGIAPRGLFSREHFTLQNPPSNQSFTPHMDMLSNTSGVQPNTSLHLRDVPMKRPWFSSGPESNSFKRSRSDIQFRPAGQLVVSVPERVQQSGKQGSSALGEINIDLPPQCRKGVENCHQALRGWIQRKTSHLQQERSVSIVRHHIFDNFVRFVFVNRGLPESPNLSVYCNPSPVIPPTRMLPDKSFSIIINAGISVSGLREARTSTNSEEKPFAYYSVVQTQDSQSSNRLVPTSVWWYSLFDSPSGRSHDNPVNITERPAQFDFAITKGILSDVVPSQTQIHKPAPDFYHQFRFSTGLLTIQPTRAGGSKTPGANNHYDTPHVLVQPRTPVVLQTSAQFAQQVPPPSPMSPPPSGRDVPSIASSSAPRIYSLSSNVDGGQASRFGLERSSDIDMRSSEPQVRYEVDNVIRLPKDRHDKPRRLLPNPEGNVVLSASLHGFVYGITSTSRRQSGIIKNSMTPSQELIDDACLVSHPLGSCIVLGHARDNQQISLVPLSSLSQSKSLSVPHTGETRGGISAVCAMMHPLMFASGGHDHLVHLWSIKEDSYIASASRLSIKHTSIVQDILPLHDTSRKLMTASADCSVHLWDLSSERIVNTVKTSNSVYHAHNAPLPYCVLLEVAHRELQFELRDYRMVPQTSVQRFGYEISKLHGRFIRGDVNAYQFACGGRDGCVRLWDVRNPKAQLENVPVFQEQKVVHVLFHQSCLVAASENNQIAFIRSIDPVRAVCIIDIQCHLRTLNEFADVKK